MSDFKPNFPFATPVELLIPTYTTVKGVPTKTFPAHGIRLNVSWKTYGGTEQTNNDLFTVLDTATVETWYRPDIKSDCRVKLWSTCQVYEIVGNPENINQRNQFSRFKVRAVESGA